MAKKELNAKCIICGKGYHLCIACERKNANWKPWKVIADTENCYNIYNVVNDYNFDKISKEEACKLLKDLDLTEMPSFKANVKAIIEKIMPTKTTAVKEEKTEEVVVEVEEADKKAAKKILKKND